MLLPGLRQWADYGLAVKTCLEANAALQAAATTSPFGVLGAAGGQVNQPWSYPPMLKVNNDQLEKAAANNNQDDEQLVNVEEEMGGNENDEFSKYGF